MDSISSVSNKDVTRDGERVYESSSSRHTNQKSFTLTTRWNSGKHVRFWHGITALQHLINPRHIVSLEEPSDEEKKALQQYCYSQDWIKGGGQILWNAIAICKMSKTFWQEQWLNIVQFHQEIRRTFSIWQENITRNLSRL